jgi:hypothetical protein
MTGPLRHAPPHRLCDVFGDPRVRVGLPAAAALLVYAP